MREWTPKPELFVLTLPEARWDYSPPVISLYRRRRTWKAEPAPTKG